MGAVPPLSEEGLGVLARAKVPLLFCLVAVVLPEEALGTRAKVVLSFRLVVGGVPLARAEVGVLSLSNWPVEGARELLR